MTSDTHAAGPVDQGEWLQTRPGERCLIRVAAAETNGAYSVVEILSQPGDSTSMHVHQNEDEHFLILEGTARVVRGDETFDAPPGTDRRASQAHPSCLGQRDEFDAPDDCDVLARRRRSDTAVDSTRRGHRRESPRSGIRCPRRGTAAARGIGDEARRCSARGITQMTMACHPSKLRPDREPDSRNLQDRPGPSPRLRLRQLPAIMTCRGFRAKQTHS